MVHRNIILILGIVVVVIIGARYFDDLTESVTEITSFEECVAAGNPVMESYPRQCKTEDGGHFVEEIEEEEEKGTLPPEQGAGSSANGCIITGCSGHVCAKEEVITTCEYREEYACLLDAVCEVQPHGACGWTRTEKLEQCINEKTDPIPDFEGKPEIQG